ncbi:MAG TPA: hypothetical protein DCZ23_05405 [Lachnospiraceae bacterium]|nr:hypothetical protein [Lachnospiraceae bacterium]
MSNIYLPKLVSRKYDEALDFHITMYDNLPYERDADFCGSQQIAMYSGHIIKYYLCLNEDNVFEVNNRDDEIENILATAQQEYVKRKTPAARPSKKKTNEESGITQEQIRTLLKDQDRDAPSGYEDDNLANENAVDAFAGVEDW